MDCSKQLPNKFEGRILLIGLTICFASLSMAFMPIRPLAQLKEQDPAKVIESAPAAAEVTLPARYWRAQNDEIAVLEATTNALVKGQIVLQARIVELQERQAALRARLVEARDAAALPTTKALYQAIIDWVDQLLQP